MYSANTTAGDVRRAPTRVLLNIHLAADVWKTETKTLNRLQRGKKKSVLMSGFDGRPQDNITNIHLTPKGMDADELFSAVTYTHVTLSGTMRSDRALVVFIPRSKVNRGWRKKFLEA